MHSIVDSLFSPSRRRRVDPIFMLSASIIYSIAIFLLPLKWLIIVSSSSLILPLLSGASISATLIATLFPSFVYVLLGSSIQLFALKSIEISYLYLNFFRLLALSSFSIFYIKLSDIPRTIRGLSRLSREIALSTAMSIKLIYEGSWLMAELYELEKINNQFERSLRVRAGGLLRFSRALLFNLLNSAIFSMEAAASLFPKLFEEAGRAKDEQAIEDKH
ncbi:MAG: hypothetical protein QXM20_00020 [Fervidicoccaceae archaeon]